MRNYIYSLIDFADVDSILDIGCGDGYDLFEIGKKADKKTKLIGLDVMEEAIEKAKVNADKDSRFSFKSHDLSKGIPFEKETFDVIFSNNMLECIKDKDALIGEINRTLKPNGQIICAHFDWDSQLIDGNNKNLVRKIVQTYNDWQQDWMADVDAWMGRRLWRTFNSTDLFEGEVYTYVLTNKKFEEPYFGYERINDFQQLVNEGLISQKVYSEFKGDIINLASNNEYFYSITMYIYVGRKIN
ncbi:MAG: methyltransferase domain-containing protein [Halarsenatibacteraceae bacterium]